jgi:hypothetical protein
MSDRSFGFDKNLPKGYLVFVPITVGVVLISIIIFTYFSFESNSAKNFRILQNEAKNIKVFISETFDYTNQINSHIGRQIAAHGAKDLKFILSLFCEADKINHRNTELFSWSSFGE